MKGNPQAGFFYHRVCSLLRYYFRRRSPKLRILNPGFIPPLGPTLVLLSTTASLRDVLALASSTSRRLQWAEMTRKEAAESGAFVRLFYRALGLRPLEKSDPEVMVTECSAILRADGWVVLPVNFDIDVEAEDNSGETLTLRNVEELLWKVESQANFQLGVHILAAHFFQPRTQDRKKEVWLHFGHGDSSQKLLASPEKEEGRPPASVRPALAEMLRGNPFCLREEQVDLFLQDLEALIKTDLKDQWSGREDWKQQPEHFELSRVLVRWTQAARNQAPEHLLYLAEALDRYREKAQQLALRRFRLETGNRLLAWGPRRWSTARFRKQVLEERRALLAEIDRTREQHWERETTRT